MAFTDFDSIADPLAMDGVPEEAQAGQRPVALGELARILESEFNVANEGDRTT